MGRHQKEKGLPCYFKERRIKWVGSDLLGLELEIVGVILSTKILIIHAMPTRYRNT